MITVRHIYHLIRIQIRKRFPTRLYPLLLQRLTRHNVLLIWSAQPAHTRPHVLVTQPFATRHNFILLILIVLLTTTFQWCRNRQIAFVDNIIIGILWI